MIKNMSRYDRKMTNEKLKKEFRRYSDEYSRLSKLAKDEYVKTLKPGARVPEKVELSGEYRNRFEDLVTEIKSNVSGILKPIKKELEDSISEAPSQEALNTIMLLGTRKNINKEELNQIVNRYGDNVQAYNAIKDIAKEHDVYLGNHQVNEDLDYIESINNAALRMSVLDANNGHATPGYVSFIEISIDNAFPVEE